MKQFLLFVVVVIALFGVLARCQTSGGYENCPGCSLPDLCDYQGGGWYCVRNYCKDIVCPEGAICRNHREGLGYCECNDPTAPCYEQPGTSSGSSNSDSDS